MPSFSQRHGLTSTRTLVQSSDLDEETRVALWNDVCVLRSVLENARVEHHQDDDSRVLRATWVGYFRSAIDDQPSDQHLWKQIKHWILKEDWFQTLDLMEELVSHTDAVGEAWTRDIGPVIAGRVNDTFERYLVGYRFVGLEITPIDTTEQAEAVAEAIDASATVRGAQHHLGRAVALLADRNEPDYPNAIKEAISAVESVCVAVTGHRTLGDALKRLKGAGVTLHPALEQAWLKMYGWSSDDGGIRHGGIEAPNADQALAKYVLVTCAAFVTYMVEAGRKAGLL